MAASTQLVAFTLDDFEARTGSAASIIRTIAGLYLRHEAAPVARTRILALATAAGVSAPTAQTAISRLADRGVLEAAGSSSLQVTAAAQAMFARATAGSSHHAKWRTKNYGAWWPIRCRRP